jgi:hypothetical protein
VLTKKYRHDFQKGLIELPLSSIGG